MKPASHILHKVRRGVQSVAYGNAIYQKILASGEIPDRLYFTLADPWPGDAQAGSALISSQPNMFDNTVAISLRHAAAVLRNLRAVGTETARQMSVQLIDNWLQHYDIWSEDEWAPHVLGERIAAWIGFYEFYAPAALTDFTHNVTSSLYRQWKHLVRTLPSSLVGAAGLQSIRGLVYGGLNFPEGDKALGLACDLLQRQLAEEILPDGGHISRNPTMQLHMLRHLVDLRSIFTVAGFEGPSLLNVAISSMVPGLKFFRHGDGKLALFHGGLEETSLLIDAVITQSEVRGRALHRLPETGYERLMAGRSLLLTDVKQPAPKDYDKCAHAGLLSFELGSGRERLIVNCGAVESGAEWRLAMAATAAHSTLTIEDTNACSIIASGGVSSWPKVEAHRYEQEGIQYIDMNHDGYYQSFGLIHQRILGLSGDGETLQGKDTLKGASGRKFAIRWHLHPSVQVSLTQGGQAALLRTASGSGWRLQIEKSGLSLESSIYCGQGTPRRSQQLKLSHVTSGPETAIAWRVIRDKK